MSGYSPEEIRQTLFDLSDEKYRGFHSKLIPTIDKETVIGVRTPALRAYAKEIFKSGLPEEFLSNLPHKYYDENNLHAFIIAMIKDYDECLSRVNAFLPFVDNWATCDTMKPKVFLKHPDSILNSALEWLKSDRTYTVRYGIITLMSLLSTDVFSPSQLNAVSDIKSEEYYIKMAQAWYFAEALTKRYDSAIEIIKEQKLDRWTHNKSIQKARESFRISDETKQYLTTLKC